MTTLAVPKNKTRIDYFPLLQDDAFASIEITRLKPEDIKMLYKGCTYIPSESNSDLDVLINEGLLLRREIIHLLNIHIRKLAELWGLPRSVSAATEKKFPGKFSDTVAHLCDKLQNNKLFESINSHEPLKKAQKSNEFHKQVRDNLEGLILLLKDEKISKFTRKSQLAELVLELDRCATGLVNRLYQAKGFLEAPGTLEGLLVQCRLDLVYHCASEAVAKYKNSDGLLMPLYEMHFKQQFLEHASAPDFQLNLPEAQYVSKEYIDYYQEQLSRFYFLDSDGKEVHFDAKESEDFFRHSFSEKYTPQAIVEYLAFSIESLLLACDGRNFDAAEFDPVTKKGGAAILASIVGNIPIFSYENTEVWELFYDITSEEDQFNPNSAYFGKQIYTLKEPEKIRENIMRYLGGILFKTVGNEVFFLEQAGYFEQKELSDISHEKIVKDSEREIELKKLFSEAGSLETAKEILLTKADFLNVILELKTENYLEVSLALVKKLLDTTENNTERNSEYIEAYLKRMKELFPEPKVLKKNIRETLIAGGFDEPEKVLKQALIEENTTHQVNLFFSASIIVLSEEDLVDLSQLNPDGTKKYANEALFKKAKQAYYQDILDEEWNEANYIEKSKSFFIGIKDQTIEPYLKKYIQKIKDIFQDRTLFKEKMQEIFPILREHERSEQASQNSEVDPQSLLKKAIQEESEPWATFFTDAGVVLKKGDYLNQCYELCLSSPPKRTPEGKIIYEELKPYVFYVSFDNNRLAYKTSLMQNSHSISLTMNEIHEAVGPCPEKIQKFNRMIQSNELTPTQKMEALKPFLPSILKVTEKNNKSIKVQETEAFKIAAKPYCHQQLQVELTEYLKRKRNYESLLARINTVASADPVSRVITDYIKKKIGFLSWITGGVFGGFSKRRCKEMLNILERVNEAVIQGKSERTEIQDAFKNNQLTFQMPCFSRKSALKKIVEKEFNITKIKPQ